MPTLAELTQMNDNAYVGYPQLQRQANKMRLAQMGRIPENLADPRTYGFVRGLMGTSPDELEMSVLSPNTAPAKDAAYYGYQLSNLGQIAPVMMPATKAALRGVGGAINDAMVYGTGPLASITPQPMRLTTYHGTPHTFDKFDASKIGTGEGAQAYGHGLYVAENPEVAQGYQKNVKDINSIAALNNQLSKLHKVMEEDSVYPGAYRKFKSEKGQKAADEYDRLMEMRNQKSTGLGNLYKVDLPDEHIAKMLDWDKPLSQQPKNVQEAFAKHDPDMYHPSGNDYSPEERGQWLYMRMANNLTQKNASKKLAEMGIPGIRYLDEGSRGIGKGTSNFVVFPGNEHLLKIESKNGKPIKWQTPLKSAQ